MSGALKLLYEKLHYDRKPAGRFKWDSNKREEKNLKSKASLKIFSFYILQRIHAQKYQNMSTNGV